MGKTMAQQYARTTWPETILDVLRAEGGQISDFRGRVNAMLMERIDHRLSAEGLRKWLLEMEVDDLIKREVVGRITKSIALTKKGWGDYIPPAPPEAEQPRRGRPAGEKVKVYEPTEKQPRWRVVYRDAENERKTLYFRDGDEANAKATELRG